VLELVAGGLVPIRVEPQQRDPLRDRLGDRVLDLAGDVADALGGETRRRHVGLDLGQPGVGEHRVVALLAVEVPVLADTLAADGHVVFGRLAHALEGVIQPERALRRARPQQRQRREHRAAALPDAALDHVALDPEALDVPDRLVERVHALDRGHRERATAAAQLVERRVGDVRVTAFGPLRRREPRDLHAQAVGDRLERIARDVTAP
jgi:hypothetical protein